MPDEMLPDQPSTDAPADEPVGAIAVRAPDGQLGTVDASKLSEALSGGFTQLSRNEVSQERDRAEVGSPVGIAATAALGIGRTATLGLSDQAIVGAAGMIGGDANAARVRETLNLAIEENPVADFAGTIGGMFVPTGLAGIAGKAAGAVKSVLPSAASMGGRILNAGISASAQGIVEGAAYGMGGQISEDALGDHETTAEHIFSAAGKGALIGGALGGVIGAGGHAAGEAAGSISGRIRGISPRTSATAAEDTAIGSESMHATDAADWDARFAESEAAKHVEDLGPGLAGKGRHGEGSSTQAIEDIASNFAKRQEGADAQAATKMAFDARATAGDVDRALDEATINLTAAANRAMDIDDEILPRIAFGEGKMTRMGKLVRPPDHAAAQAAALGMRDAVEEKLIWLESLPNRGGSEGGVSKMRKATDVFDKKWDYSSKTGTVEEKSRDIFLYADQLNRDVGKASGMGGGIGPMGRTEAQREFYSLYHELAKPLRSEALWGPAGIAQTEINLATTTKLQTSDFLKKSFLSNFETVAGNAKTRFMHADVKGYLRNVNGSENLDKAEALSRWNSGLRGQMDVVEKHYDLSVAEKAEFNSARVAMNDFETVLAKAKSDSAAVAKLKVMREAEAGHGVKIPFLNIVTDAFTRPIATAERLGTIKHIVDGAAKKITDSLDAGFAGIRAGSPAAAMSREDAVRIGQDASRTAAQPSLMVERIGRAFAGVNEAAPKVATFLSSIATRNMSFLAAKAPKSSAPMATLTPQFEEPRFSDSDVASFARTYRAWANPDTVLSDMAHGALTREGVEVLQKCYPKIYAQVQTKALEKLSDLKHPPSYEQRIQLGTLLSIPSDPTTLPSFVAAMQAAKKTSVQGGGAVGAPPQVGSQSSGRHGRPISATGYQTESGRIAGL